MESRFASLRQRDTSVSMLRVKMSRRRSQTQKENRRLTVNKRRQLDVLQELETSSQDASMARSNMSTLQEREANVKPEKIKAPEERLKQLERWKERKALQKEKEKREKQQKGVFKTGIYHPKDIFTGHTGPPTSAKLKEKKVNVAPPQSTRVTRSMKQQEVQQIQNPVAAQNKVKPDPGSRTNRLRAAPGKAAPPANNSKVCSDRSTTAGPAVQALPSRPARRPPVTKAPAGKDKLTDGKSTRTRAALAPSSGHKAAVQVVSEPIRPTRTEDPEVKEGKLQDAEKKPSPPKQTACSEEDDMQVEEAAAPPSFAPKDFTFQAPLGLSSFKFEPLTPRSADAFLTPSPTFNLPPVPPFTLDPAELRKPSPPRSVPAVSAPSPCSPLESKHDVPYFRSEISKETERLTTCCHDWESKVEDESIPEEMRDRMRTAVGQARLLMKERFNQFSGLVDDCELGRGDKVTTCTDLQGFWDMVYYQVEDVNKKFDALKEAESRSWAEESKPPPRQRKVVKKLPAALPKPTGTNAAAKSRLAAVKAAVRAKQQAAEAEKASQDAAQKVAPPTEALKSETVLFDGGFFKVESPAKSSIRKSGRLSGAVPPQASPCFITPKRATRLSLALDRTPVGSGVQLSRSAFKQTPASRCQQETNASLCFSPVKEVPSIEERSPTLKAGSVSPATTSAEPAVLSGLSPGSRPASPALQAPAETPNCSISEDIPGLDFERYLQPSQRCSLSPREPAAEERLSPMATDVEMESPIGGAEESLHHLEPALSAGSSVFSPQSPQVQSAKASLLLFTPDLKDRIRQSVCPTDLMSFTPPSNI